ncbi:hypothetical protein TNCV_1137481 [Trichonephila clavipes]|nr:hypothetical protein TNCV_1137481 [Trichonephila clavipes]
MHVRNTSTLSLEKTALLDKLQKLEESNLEKVDKLVKLEEKRYCFSDFLSLWSAHFQDSQLGSRRRYALLQAPYYPFSGGFERKREGNDSDGRGSERRG